MSIGSTPKRYPAARRGNGRQGDRNIGCSGNVSSALHSVSREAACGPSEVETEMLASTLSRMCSTFIPRRLLGNSPSSCSLGSNTGFPLLRSSVLSILLRRAMPSSNTVWSPKATYERRKVARRLSSDEGTRLARVARIWSLALDVWQNDDDARLPGPHPMIEDKRPIDVVIHNAEMVVDNLGRLKFTSAA